MLFIYVDGGVISRNPSPYGGTYAYRLVHEDGNVLSEGCEIILYPGCTNNMSEYLAALYGMTKTPSNIPATLFSDSQITLGRIFHGWKTNGIFEQWKNKMNTEYNRLKGFLLHEIVDGHPTKLQLSIGIGKRGNKCNINNVWCDKACQQKSKQFLEKLNTHASTS